MPPAQPSALLLLLAWWPRLLDGAETTLGLLALSAALTLVISVAVGLARLARWPWLRLLAGVYVTVLRGVSVYVVLFWMYFVLPFFGVTFSPWSSAIVALGMVHGAYASEHVRQSVRAVARGQREAARALSFNTWQTQRYVVFPQAVAMAMPLAGNELVTLLKSTSVASLISVVELTSQAHAIAATTFRTFPALFSVLLIYFALAQAVLYGFRHLERRLVVWRAAPPARRPAIPLSALPAPAAS